MNHWFDELTTQLATDKLTRRSVFAAATATLTAVATGTGWPRLLSAAVGNAAPQGGYQPVLPTPSTFKYGACMATSHGVVLKHQVTSTATSGGRKAVLHATRSSDLKGMTTNKTVLLDGKQAFQITSIATKTSKSIRLTIGDAFGFKGAELASTDDGQTLTGKIEGRELVPYVKGAGKKLQFADGKPWNPKETPGARDALKAAFAQHSADLKACGSQAGAGTLSGGTSAAGQLPAVQMEGHRKAAPGYTEFPGEDSKPISAINTNAYLTPACVACADNCDPGLLTGAVDAVECIVGIFTFNFELCSDWVKLTGKQEKCFERCNADPACFGQLCIPKPNSSVAMIPTCNKGDICLEGAPGYCCPHGFPNPCPGYFSTTCPSYEPGCWGQEDFNNFCCAQDAVCVSDSSPALDWNFKGGSIALCCPKDRACGTKAVVSGGVHAFPYFKGSCCAPGDVCAESALPGMIGQRECCNPSSLRNGKCCSGKWCGNQCCSGPCNGDKCAELCLGGYTTAGKCCTSGMACGKICCPSGCADAATSTCGTGTPQPPPK
jgi:hypothetical protein